MCFTILCIQMCDNPACAGLGCPIRRSPDQSLLGDSPRLIAACYVLHRLLKSRHPPCACVTAFHCCPRNFRPLRDESLSDLRLPIRQFLPDRHIASPTLLCLPVLPAFRVVEEKWQVRIVKVNFCGNGNPLTRRFGISAQKDFSRKKRWRKLFSVRSAHHSK